MANTKAIGVAYSDQALVNGSVDNSPIGATTPNTGAFTTLSADSFTTSGTTPNYFAGNVVVETNSSLAALRVTQTGSGNALLIEDSGNPDSTPVVVDPDGNVGIGTTTSGYKLDIAPTATGAALRLRGGSGGSSAFQFTDLTLSAQWGVLNATASSISLAHNAVLAFTTNTVERFRIASTGIISLGATAGSESLRVTPVASSVNYLETLGGATGSFPTLTVQGSDTNIGLIIASKGTSPIITRANGFQIQNAASVLQFLVVSTASAVNYLQATGAVTTGSPVLSAQGSDTNIDITLTPKGTGVLRFGTYTAGILAQAGYITIKDAAGNTRNLLVG